MCTTTQADPATIPCATDRDEYGFTVGDSVVHVKDASWTGVCARIDRNLPHPSTCGIRWDEDPDHVDGQFTNKLRRTRA